MGANVARARKRQGFPADDPENHYEPKGCL